MEMPEKYGQSGKSRRNNNVWGGYGRLKDVMYKLTIFGVVLTSISYSSTSFVDASYNAGEKRFSTHFIVDIVLSLLSCSCSSGPPPGYGQTHRGQYGQQQQGQQYGQRQQGQQQQPPSGGPFGGGPPHSYGQSSRQPGGPPPGFGQQSVIYRGYTKQFYIYS